MKRLLIILGVVCAACTEEERTPLTYTEATEQSSTSIADTATRPRSVVPDPQDTLIVPLPSSTGSMTIALAPDTITPAPSGIATLKANGFSTIVSVSLRSPIGAGNYDGIIHRGSCAKPGPAVTSLNPISTDSLGKGASASFIDVPLDTLQVRDHVMIVGKGGRKEACGVIQGILQPHAETPG